MANITSLQLKEMLVKTFDLDMDPSEISDDTAIIGSGLELDSVDVLEIVSQIEKNFKVRIKNEHVKKEAFATVANLTAFINSYQA